VNRNSSISSTEDPRARSTQSSVGREPNNATDVVRPGETKGDFELVEGGEEVIRAHDAEHDVSLTPKKQTIDENTHTTQIVGSKEVETKTGEQDGAANKRAKNILEDGKLENGLEHKIEDRVLMIGDNCAVEHSKERVEEPKDAPKEHATDNTKETRVTNSAEYILIREL